MKIFKTKVLHVLFKEVIIKLLRIRNVCMRSILKLHSKNNNKIEGGIIMEFDAKIIFEMGFNIIYLILIWTLTFKMYTHTRKLDEKGKKIGNTLTWAFALLALGDSGHVGFRVVAYLKGGLIENAALIGYGKMATAVTMTIFYALLIKVWKVRCDEKYNGFTNLLFLSALVRLLIVFCPRNQWTNITAPFEWAMYRNIPFMILGIGVVILFFKGFKLTDDKVFKWLAISIIISYGFYTPVILFAQKVPTVGILMIPKTMAYVAAGVIAYKGFVKKSEVIAKIS